MQVNNQPQQGSTSTPAATRVPPASADSQKIFSPTNTEQNSSIFSFTNNSEHMQEDDLLDGTSSRNQSMPPVALSHYPEEMQPELPMSIGLDHSIHREHRDNIVSLVVPEKEVINLTEQEIEQNTVLIEHCPNTALLMQTPSPVITQTVPPHHIIPVSSSPSPLALPQPISPTTPPQVSDHPPSVMHMGNTFSWPYQQQPMVPMSHDFSQTLPLLPQVPALTPTTQSNTFFRVF